VAESGVGHLQGYYVCVYHRLCTIIAFHTSNPGRQQTKLLNKVSRNTRDIGRRVEPGP
jgi:hypothetical protein